MKIPSSPKQTDLVIKIWEKHLKGCKKRFNIQHKWDASQAAAHMCKACFSDNLKTQLWLWLVAKSLFWLKYILKNGLDQRSIT